MNVSLYDLLDVEEAATAAEIRSAWKAAIADLDPTDRRFRAYNDAAGVLLDPEKRAAYDAELAASRGDEVVDDEVVDDEVVDDEPEPEPEPEYEPEYEAEPEDTTTPAGGPPVWALLVAAVAAVVALAVAVVVLSWPGSLGGPSPKEREQGAEAAETAADSAEAAAADAVPVVLSYDYRTIDADFAEAAKYLTDDFTDKRTALFDEKAESGLTLREQVVADKVVVTARVSYTGLTRVSPDGDRATVVVYVDQDSQKGKSAPRSLQMWATLSMVLDGGDWLLDDICTEDDCG
jgi:Mce-associated membrane protein